MRMNSDAATRLDTPRGSTQPPLRNKHRSLGFYGLRPPMADAPREKITGIHHAVGGGLMARA